MGVTQLVTQPYARADGQELVTYVGNLTQECARLQEEGRFPDDQPIRDFLHLLDTIAARIQSDLRTANGDSLTTAIEMTKSEYQKNWAMIDVVNSLLFILEMRGALDLQRTEGADRVMGAIRHGTPPS
jgi:hypothetical protein